MKKLPCLSKIFYLYIFSQKLSEEGWAVKNPCTHTQTHLTTMHHITRKFDNDRAIARKVPISHYSRNKVWDLRWRT